LMAARKTPVGANCERTSEDMSGFLISLFRLLILREPPFRQAGPLNTLPRDRLATLAP
jgi:hypothetical protein